jgi:O-antigen ligase
MTWGKVLAIAMVIILLLNMILLSAKMPIIAFGLIMLFLLIRKNIFLGMMNKKRWLIAGSIITLLILGMFIFTRWGELFTGLTYRNIEQQENSVGIRKGITQCGLQLSKEHFLAGIGPQNVQQALNQCYYQFEGDDFSRHSFNTHNQYLDSLISHGILGLVLLLIMIIYPIVQAIRLKDPILLSFTLLIALCMLTENILSRQAGVVFYAFFNSILLNQAYSQKSRQS